MISLILNTWRKSFSWEGRASRKEYWLFTFTVISIALMVLVTSIYLKSPVGLLAYTAWLLLCFPASLSVTVRRLHDINLSAWWVLGLMTASVSLELVKVFGGAHGQPLYVMGAAAMNLSALGAMLWKGTSSFNRYGAPPIPTVSRMPTPEEYLTAGETDQASGSYQNHASAPAGKDNPNGTSSS